MATWFRTNAIALIGQFLTLVSVTVGVLMVIWQLHRQHRSSLALQREAKRQELKLRIYETLTQRMNSVADKLREAWMYVFVIPGNVEMRASANGYSPRPLDQRAPKFSE